MLANLFDLATTVFRDAADAALDGLPGAGFGDKLEFAANILGIAGFMISLALLLFGPIYRRGWRRLATRGDLERLGGSVAETLGERITAQLTAAALTPVDGQPPLRGAEAGATLDRVHADLAAAVALVLEDTSEDGRDATLALLDGDTGPAEILLTARAGRHAVAVPHAAAEALHLSAALRSTHDCAGAVDACRDALRIEPDSALGWSRLAHLYLRLGRQAEARAAFDRALACATPQPVPGMASAA